MYKHAGTLDVIKQSGKKILDNIDPVGATTAAGLGGLAGYLYDQSTDEADASALKSALRTGTGAAVGLGIYGIVDALSRKKALIDTPKERPAIIAADPIFASLATLGGAALGRAAHSRGWEFGEAASIRRQLNKRKDALTKADKNPSKDQQYQDLQKQLTAAEKADPWGRGWRELAAAGQKHGLRNSIKNVRAAGLKGTLNAAKQYGVRGWLPKPYSATTIATLAALGLSASPYVRQKLYDLTLDF